MSNKNNQRQGGQKANAQGSTDAPSKKDIAAESSKAEGQQLKNEAAQSGRRVTETAKDQAVAAKNEAVDQAQDLLGQLKNDLQSYVGPQQERLASTARSVSDEVTALSQGKKPETDYVTGLLGSVSGTVNSFATSLESKEPQELLGDVRRFAARRPGTFLAIAAGIGLLAGRATRSARDSEEIGNSNDAAPAQPHVYGTPAADQATRTYTEKVPETVYPGEHGERR